MRSGLALCLLCVAAAIGGCKKKSDPASEVTGLAAVPASAEVVVGIDPARVANAPLVTRAVDQLLARDTDLEARWAKLRDTCKIDLPQIKQLLLAIGPKVGDKPGTGPVLLVATGQLAETELAACVRSMVGQGGGQLTAKDLSGRTLYQAKDGNRTMFFAFGRPDTVVLGSNEQFVTEALGAGKKALDNADLKKWIGMTDVKAAVWAAGKVDDRVRSGLVKVTNGQLSAGPAAIALTIDPSAGLKLDAAVVMANAADAKALESFVKGNIGILGMAAQGKSLGKIVDRVEISAADDQVRFHVHLDLDEVNQILSALDEKGAPAQDSPAPGSGSSAAP